MKKFGFTLAEVLLTLAIIGVVAALTIPAVITKVTQDQYVVGLKKAYNTLKAIQREAEQVHGPMENWDWKSTAEITFVKYFKPHFDILKDCGTGTDDGCFADDVEDLSGNNTTSGVNSTGFYRITTSDGMSYMFNSECPSCVPMFGEGVGNFIVDVNGKKGPNIIGRDVFAFVTWPLAGGIKPMGAFEYDNRGGVCTYSEKWGTYICDDAAMKGISSADVDANCSTSAGEGAGSYCAAKVLSEGAMNY